MSKPVKNLITESYKKKFGQMSGGVLIDVRGIPSNTNNKLRATLAGKQVKVTVVRNSLAKRAFEGTPMEPLAKLMDGPTGLVYGGESVVDVARQLIALTKDMETLQFKGALMEGVIFAPDEIKALSKYPTKIEAQGQVVTLMFGPGRKLAGQILGPGRKIGGIVKAIEERAKEKEGASAPAA